MLAEIQSRIPLLGRASRSHDQRRVQLIRELAKSDQRLSDRGLATEFACLVANAGKSPNSPFDDLLPPTFSLVVEAVRRILSITLYDEQLLGGMALARGEIAEIPTGEGKTLVASLAAALFAARGRGVHVMTVNSYLANRDFELLQPVFAKLGLSTGLISDAVDPHSKSAAYRRDITYGPGYEFGFDYLRDRKHANLAPRKLGDAFLNRLTNEDVAGQRLQHDHAFAIVDEADSVMIDEATTPLVLADHDTLDADAWVFRLADKVARGLRPDEDYVLNPSQGMIDCLTAGNLRIQKSMPRLAGRRLTRPWKTYVENAIRARALLHKDEHYVVRHGEIQIVDRPTGRIFSDRTWREGLHQAVQAKEHVEVTAESRSTATISRQRFLGLYEHLCGMTGTARECRRELASVYGTSVTAIPPHLPEQREQWPLRVFTESGRKLAAIAQSAREISSEGRPVLIGSPSISASLELSRCLGNIDHVVLNGTQDATEAEIIARAGEGGTITVATNMAGRGTDIAIDEQVASVGGLHVIVSEPQSSMRAERQLIGRASRQGKTGKLSTVCLGRRLPPGKQRA